MKIKFVICLLLVSYGSFAQLAPNKYLLRFTDKNNSAFSVERPDEFLSARALERRARFNIPLTENDLPVNSQYINELERLGLSILYASKWLNAVVVATENSNLIAEAEQLAFVKTPTQKTEKRFKKPANANYFKTLPQISYDYWGKNEFAYGEALTQIEMLNGQYLHNQHFTGEGMQIAILDAGFYKANELPAFDSLNANNQILGTWDFVNSREQVYDVGYHGMKVLSIMAGNIPDELIGTAPHAKYWLFRTEDYRSEYQIEELNWLAAIERADSLGVDVVNSSLGYAEFDAPEQNYTYANMDGKTAFSTQAAAWAAEKGMLVVVSAGNKGGDNWRYITAPGDADGIVTVGAVDFKEQYAAFSSQGPTADGRVKPTVSALGMATALQDEKGNVTYGNGTSFSSPVIAGMLACLWQAHPQFTNNQIIEVLEKSSNQFVVPDEKLGYGIPNFQIAHDFLSKLEENITNKNNLLIYPNPFNDYIDIELLTKIAHENSANEAISIQISIFNLLGNKLFSQTVESSFNGFNKFRISQLDDFKSGLYIVQIKTNAQIFQQIVAK